MPVKKSELYSSLWASCDELRGGMDASQYKDYVLVLLFVKYVSDKYAGQKDALLDVPAGGRFADMVALKGDKEIGDKMNKIIARLAEANDLKGVIDVADFNDGDKLGKGKEMVDRLTNLVSIFDNAALDFSGNRAEGDDLLGDAYEYLMRHFATESGKSKGQFYTPAEVSRVMPGFHGEWEVKRVLELGEVVTGGTPRTVVEAFWGNGYPWITPTDISTHRDMFTSERTLTQKGLNAIRALPANTVLVTCIASIGKNAILKTVGGCNQQINGVTPNKNNNVEFLYYVFEASKQYLLANAGSTATSILSKAAFAQLTFKVPLLAEQTAIAGVLSDMDAELAALEQRLAKTRALKQGMMQELLTGRTRLVESGKLRVDNKE